MKIQPDILTDEAKNQKLRQQVAEEITSLENKAEREKESIHEQK